VEENGEGAVVDEEGERRSAWYGGEGCWVISVERRSGWQLIVGEGRLPWSGGRRVSGEGKGKGFFGGERISQAKREIGSEGVGLSL
jgi:hypothetical protein